MVHLSNKYTDRKTLHITNSYHLYFKKWLGLKKKQQN